MAEPTQGHNGHHDLTTGAERIRSGFDRRKNWGESIENIYRRIDHRLSELVHQGGEKGRALEGQAEQVIERYPSQTLALCFAAGVLLGVLIGRSGERE
jgi:ElaB/YqjD/DUF883 family membrane-anchored ribosome-binding protein